MKVFKYNTLLLMFKKPYPYYRASHKIILSLFKGMNKRFIIYGILLAVAAVLLQVLQYKLVLVNHSLELYGGILAAIFTLVGITAGRRFAGKKEILIEKQVPVYVNVSSSQPFELNDKALEKSGISKRELEILELMAMGMSNQEIADKLFVSIHTIKTHTSNLFLKLDVKRRTQAVIKARELQLIA